MSHDYRVSPHALEVGAFVGAVVILLAGLVLAGVEAWNLIAFLSRGTA